MLSRRFSRFAICIVAASTLIAAPPLRADEELKPEVAQAAQDKDAREKIAALDAKIATSPQDADLYVQRAAQWMRTTFKGTFYDEVGEKKKALADLNRALEIAPQNADALFVQTHIRWPEMIKAIEAARKQAASGAYVEPPIAAELEGVLRRALQSDSNYFPAHTLLARLELERNGEFLTITTTPKLLEVFQLSPGGRIFSKPISNDEKVYGPVFMRALEHAIKAHDISVEIGEEAGARYASRVPDALNFRGDVIPTTWMLIDSARRRSQWQSADVLLKNLLQLEPDNFKAYLTLSDNALRSQNFSEAEQYATRAIDVSGAPKLQADRAAALSQRARVLLAQVRGAAPEVATARVTQAVKDLDAAIALDARRSHQYRVMHAGALLARGDMNGALKDLNDAIAEAKYYGPAYQLRAQLLRATNRIPEAEADEKMFKEIAASEKEAARIRRENGLDWTD